MRKRYLLGGIGAVAGLLGIAKGVKTISDNSETKEIVDKCEELYKIKIQEGNLQKDKTKIALISLGKLKLDIWNNEINRATSFIEDVKNLNFKEETGIPEKEFVNMRDMSLRANDICSNVMNTLEDEHFACIASYGGSEIFEYSSTGDSVSTLLNVAAANPVIAFLLQNEKEKKNLEFNKDNNLNEPKRSFSIHDIKSISFKKNNNINDKEKSQMILHSIGKMDKNLKKMIEIEILCNLINSNIHTIRQNLNEVLEALEDEVTKIHSLKKQNRTKNVNSLLKLFDKENVFIDYEKLDDNQKINLKKCCSFIHMLNSILEIPILNRIGNINDNLESKISEAIGKFHETFI